MSSNKLKISKHARERKSAFTSFMSMFKNSVEMAADETAKEMAKALADEAKTAIVKQAYNWHPLSPRYVAYKKRNKLDPRIYVARGEFVNAISWGVTHGKVWAGLPSRKIHEASGLPLRVLGRILEFGAKRSVITEHGIERVQFIPPRPIWRTALSKIMGQQKKFARKYRSRVRAAMKQKRKGKK
jgi:hypothetical protein